MREYGVVIPVGPQREQNLTRVLESLVMQTKRPSQIVLVCDGEEAWLARGNYTIPTIVIHANKHRPGMEQPRNTGVRCLQFERPDITHVAFLDTDVLVGPTWLYEMDQEIERGGDEGFYYGPYEFLPHNYSGMWEERKGWEPRWPMFDVHTPGTRYNGDLSKGLGAFSGNLVWNITDFAKIGGFWNEIHHGRCEDGELGIRAVGMGIPVGLAPAARGWHQWHPSSHTDKAAKNRRDVPMIDRRHPWVSGGELFVVDEDGKRFNARCECGWEGNTLEIWAHLESEAHKA